MAYEIQCKQEKYVFIQRNVMQTNLRGVIISFTHLDTFLDQY
jgi:hypothetical protein